LAQKSAIYGEGLYRKCQSEGQKSAITEKEMAIFELRKVLFLEKHLRELPGACWVIGVSWGDDDEVGLVCGEYPVDIVGQRFYCNFT
jgi:hypothetical protein